MSGALRKRIRNAAAGHAVGARRTGACWGGSLAARHLAGGAARALTAAVRRCWRGAGKANLTGLAGVEARFVLCAGRTAGRVGERSSRTGNALAEENRTPLAPDIDQAAAETIATVRRKRQAGIATALGLR